MRRDEKERRLELRRLWAIRLKHGHPADSVPTPPESVNAGRAERANIRVQDDHTHHLTMTDNGNLYTHNGKWWGVVDRERGTVAIAQHTKAVTLRDWHGCYWRGVLKPGGFVSAWRTCSPALRRPVWFGPRHMKPSTHRMPKGHGEKRARVDKPATDAPPARPPLTGFGADPDIKPGPMTMDDRGYDPREFEG